MISRSIDQLTCQCRPFRCCQAYSGDQGHHDKPSHPAARHDCLDGDAARDLRIPCADRACCHGASQGRGCCPSRRQEGGAEGCPAAGRRTEGAGSAAAPTPGRSTSAPSRAAAASARCGSAAASNTPAAASGGCTTSAPDGTSAAPGCRTESADSASAAPGGCTFAPDATTTPSADSSTHSTEAACRTDSATAAGFISEGDAITCAAAPAAAVWRHQAAAGSCHYAGSDSAADGRPSAGRKHDDSTTVASRRAPECGRSDCHANHTARTTRCAAVGHAGRSCCADRDPCAGNEPRAERRRRSHDSRRRDASWRHGACGTNRRAGRAKRHATGRPGTERPADRRAGFPPGASGHRSAASGSAAGSRDQSHCPRCATDRTATP